MDDKKFRKISKKELLEILLEQAKRIEELEQEINKTKSKLDSKKIAINESGSLAEASLKLNGVFEAAEEAAEQYLLNIKEKCKKIENDTKKECQIEKENMLKETEELCQQKKKEADEYLAKIELKVKELSKKKKEKTTKSTNKTTVKDSTKVNSSKKKAVTKTKKEDSQKTTTAKKISPDKETKVATEKKVVVSRSKNAIQGRPVKTVTKGALVHE